MQEIDYLEQNNNMQIVLKTGSLEITCFFVIFKDENSRHLRGCSYT